MPLGRENPQAAVHEMVETDHLGDVWPSYDGYVPRVRPYLRQQNPGMKHRT
jgi:hypothetical protein